MPCDAFVAATPTLRSLTFFSRHATPLARGSTPRLRSPRGALRVGAVNGDSRAPDRDVLRRPRTDKHPLIAGMYGMLRDAPATQSRKRARAMYKARRKLNDDMRAKLTTWAGDVCGGPAAHFLHVLRKIWYERAEGLAAGMEPEPMDDLTRRLIGRVREEIRKCDEAYYCDEPVKRIKDEEYDELLMHLAEMERVYPELVTEDSPTQRVGHAAAATAARGEHILKPLSLATVLSQRFPPHRHITRMLSLANAYSPSDVTAFLTRAAKLQAELYGEEEGCADKSDAVVAGASFCVEAKVDGVALGLSYRNGKLTCAATRGDGVVGDDVTDNVREALVGRGVPEVLPESVNVDVRGEVFIRPDEFEALPDKEYGRLANPRNAAAGGLKNKDPKEAAKRMMRFVAYDCLLIPDELIASAHERQESENDIRRGMQSLSEELKSEERSVVVNYWPTQMATLEGLGTWGFGAMSVFRICCSEDEINTFALQTEEGRKELPFEADGVVIKVNDSGIRQAMGHTAKSPRGAVALKFHSLGAETVVQAVTMQVSRSGIVTPVAILRPVTVGGVVISRATLHNFDEIERLDLAVNDTVLVERGGDVIPKIKSVKIRSLHSERSRIEIPTQCPSCGGKVTASKEPRMATVVHCENREVCSAQALGRLLHFCRRDAMDIQGLGEQTGIKLLAGGLVSPPDLFAMTRADIMDLDGFQEKSATSLHSAIQNASNSRSLERVIIGLGIPGVGRASSRALAMRAQTIEGLGKLGEANEEDLMSLPNVAEKSASAIHRFLNDPRVAAELHALASALTLRSVVDDSEAEDPYDIATSSAGHETRAGSNPFAGKTVAFTGKIERMARPEAMRRIRALGGKIVSVVSKKTGYVVVGSDPGLKYQKALRCNTPILSEDDLMIMLEAPEVEP